MLSHWRVGFFFLCGLSCACPQSPPPVDPPAHAGTESRAGPHDPTAAFEAISEPRPASQKLLGELRAAAAEAAKGTKLPESPVVGDVGREIIPGTLPGKVYDAHAFTRRAFRHRIDDHATGPEINAHRRLLSRRPWAQLDSEGQVSLFIETARPLVAATAYYGTVAAEDPLGLNRWRYSEPFVLSTDETELRHRARFSLRKVVTWRHDVGRALARGRGVLSYRVAMVEPGSATAKLVDGRIAFRCAHTPCRGEPELIQLPAIVGGPRVDLVTSDSAVVSLETDGATSGVVYAWSEGNERQMFRSDRPGVHHEVALHGLEPSTRYRYYAFVVDGRGEVSASHGATFMTAPGPSGPHRFSFVVMSDGRSGVGTGEEHYVGTNKRVLHAVLLQAFAAQPRFVLFVGDLIDGLTTLPEDFRFQLDGYQSVVDPFGAFFPIYEVMGNHETLVRAWDPGWAVDRPGLESGEALFAEVFVNPRNGPRPRGEQSPPYEETVFSFGYGNVHVAAVNSNYWFRSHFDREDHPAAEQGYREGWVDDAQLEWLDDDLAEARRRGAAHLIVCTHEPAFPVGGHAHDAMYYGGRIPEVLERRNRFLSILGRHGVALLAHGDEHNYSRMLIDEQLVPGLERPLWQIITGGAGAPFYAQDMSLPWADRVEGFDPRQHMVVLHVDGARLTAEAISVSGALIDRFVVEAEGL